MCGSAQTWTKRIPTLEDKTLIPLETSPTINAAVTFLKCKLCVNFKGCISLKPLFTCWKCAVPIPAPLSYYSFGWHAVMLSIVTTLLSYIA